MLARQWFFLIASITLIVIALLSLLWQNALWLFAVDLFRQRSETSANAQQNTRIDARTWRSTDQPASVVTREVAFQA